MFTKITNPITRQFAVVFAANLTVIVLGMHNVWSSPMLIKLRDENQTILSRPITLAEEAWIVSVNSIVGIVVLFFTGWLMDMLGRKWLLFITIIPRLTMSMLVIFANDVWMILLGRAMGGLADMITISVVYTYCSEVAGKEIRGGSGTMAQITTAIGTLLIFGVGPFVSYLTINILMAGITLAVFVPILFIPESPYFLFMKGKTNKAVEVLTYLRGTEELAHEEIRQYSTQKESKDNIESNKSIDTQINKNKWVLLKDKTVLKTLGIIVYLSISQQMIGHSAVNFYLQSIFEITNTSLSSEVSSLVIGFIQLLASLMTFFITDRFGRKPILCTTLVAVGIGMIGLAVFFQILHGTDAVVGFLNYLPLISVAIIIYAFNAGPGSLFWMLVAELLEGSLRPYGVSMSIIISISTVTIISLLFPTIMTGVGVLIVWWVFAGFCFGTSLFIALLVPETKGKTFVEIQRDLCNRDTVAILDKSTTRFE